MTRTEHRYTDTPVADAALVDAAQPLVTGAKPVPSGWRRALGAGTVTFIASRLAVLAVMVLHGRVAPRVSASGLINSWLEFDSVHFLRIAEHGYGPFWQDSAFFPLYPLLIRTFNAVLPVGDLKVALLISNVACWAFLVVLFRLAAYELGDRVAERVVLYLVAFPTAYFLAAAYNHSLFLLLAAGCLYAMRRGHWWLAGALGALASATRSEGIVLALPLVYEYLRQRGFRLGRVRAGLAAAALVPAGLVGYCLYSWQTLGNPWAFSHAQTYWKRGFDWPWHAVWMDMVQISRHPLLDDYALILDLGLTLAFAVLLVLCVVGPWKLRRDQLYLVLYGVPVFLLPLLFPSMGTDPLISMARLVIDVVPAFLILSRMGANRTADRIYLIPSVALQFVLLAMFLNHVWTF